MCSFECVHICGVPDGGCVVCRPCFVQKHPVGQILVEVSTLHVLSDHTERVAAHTHSQQADDVRVLQARQDLHLFQEVVPTRRETLLSHRQDNN